MHPMMTHRNIHIKLSRESRSQSRIQNYATEENFTSRLVDSSIRLNEHRVALVHVLNIRRITKKKSIHSFCGQVISSWCRISNLEDYENYEKNGNLTIAE